MGKLLTRHNLYIFIGLGGVNKKESRSVRSIGYIFLYVIVFAAMGLLVEWQLQAEGKIDEDALLIFNWVIWLVFVSEFIVLLSLVKGRWRFVRENWLLPIIILLGIPFLLNYSAVMVVLRSLRPFLAVLLMLPALGMIGKFFADGRLLTTLFAALIIVVFIGLLVAGVDPNIENAWDGIWWALATVSTVGYGDVVPTSLLGRLIGGALVVLGLGVFVVITANFLAIVLRKEVTGMKREEIEVAEILREVSEIKESQKEVHKFMKHLNSRLDQMEE